MAFHHTPGGNRLKALRVYAGRTQLDIELEANLGSGYLQRVESGKVRQPERETLERILTALEARYTERREILELFGYVVSTPLPDAGEIQWAVNLCQQELNNAVFPAYLLDCSHRLLAWNDFVPRLYDMKTLLKPAEQTGYVSIFRALFDPVYGLTARISNPEEFFPAQIRAMRYEMWAFHGEAWHDALMAEMQHYPLFETYQAKAEAQAGFYIAARPLKLLELNIPLVGKLQFRLMSETFAQDRRFRVMYYLPADASTMQQCLLWAAD